MKFSQETLLIVQILALFLVVFWSLRIPGQSVAFLSASVTRDLLAADFDGYIRDLNDSDLQERGCVSTTDYMKNVQQAASDFSPTQKRRLVQTASKVDLELRKRGLGPIAQIPWKFALTQGSLYEFGLPHTRGNIIFLSTESDFSRKILCHEKVHVFQKTYPEIARQWALDAGFLVVGRRRDYPLIKANPDVDEFVYAHISDGIPMVQLHNQIGFPEIEHPFEYFAYRLQESVIF